MKQQAESDNEVSEINPVPSPEQNPVPSPTSEIVSTAVPTVEPILTQEQYDINEAMDLLEDFLSKQDGITIDKFFEQIQADTTHYTVPPCNHISILL